MKATSSFVLSAPNQIGFAVRDVDATLQRYRARYGWEPASVATVDLNESCAYRYRGRPSFCRLKIGVIEQGAVQLEFIELLDGEHPVGDYLRQHGEGINHLGFFVEDLDAIVKNLAAEGVHPVIEGRFEIADGRAGAFIYVNDDDAGGTMLEMVALK